MPILSFRLFAFKDQNSLDLKNETGYLAFVWIRSLFSISWKWGKISDPSDFIVVWVAAAYIVVLHAFGTFLM